MKQFNSLCIVAPLSVLNAVEGYVRMTVAIVHGLFPTILSQHALSRP